MEPRAPEILGNRCLPAFPTSNYSLTSTHKLGLHALDRKLGRRIPPTKKLGDKWFAAGHGTVVSKLRGLPPQAPTTSCSSNSSMELGTTVCVWVNKFSSLFFTQLTPDGLRKTGESGPSSRSGWPGRKARVLGRFDGVGGGRCCFYLREKVLM